MRKTLIATLAGLAVTACLSVSAAGITVVDVTSAGAHGNGQDVNGADFNYANPQPTGTGFIDPFLREQAKSTDNGVEFGVNTSIKAQTIDAEPQTIEYDNKDPVNYTHDLAISSLTPVNGKYRFFLDANQVNNGPISLTTFKIFVYDGATGFTDAAALGNFLKTANPAFDMNGGSKQYQINIASDSGSGSGDMYVNVPTTGITGHTWLYMVADFGQSGFLANDGFEEWWTRTSTPPPPGVPDTASALSLLGMAITGIEIFRRKIRA